MSKFFEVLDDLRAKSPRQPAPAPAPTRELARALVTDNAETKRTYITVPIESAALVADDFLLHLSGRLVEAEKANRNGALWTLPDLQFGVSSVAMGPLNWLHEERKIVGVLTDGKLVERESADAEGIGPHIQTAATIWSYLYPDESRTLREQADAGKAFFSMECVSRSILCTGPNGCGKEFPYMDAMTGNGCQHITERSSHRRFVDPIFQGAGIIVPPMEPGWGNAHIEMVRQAASRMEKSPAEAAIFRGDEQIAAQFMAFVKQGARG